MKLMSWIFTGALVLGSNAEATSLTWQQVVDQVASNNDAIRAAQSKLEAAEQQVTVARSNYFPQVSASYSGGKSGKSDGTTDSTSTSSSVGLTVSQNLFNGLSDLAKINQSQANLRATQSDLIAAKAQASYDLKFSFESYTYAKEFVSLASQIIKRREDNMAMVELRFENGRENKGSVLLSKANLAQANYDLLVAKNSKESARTSLATALGIDDPVGFDVLGTVPIRDPESIASFQKLVVSVPDHLRAVATEESSEAAITTARAGFFPTLSVDGSLGRFSAMDYVPESNNTSWAFGVKLTWPLFNGLRDLGAIRSASATYRASASLRKNIDRDQTATLVAAYNKYVEAVTKLKVDETFKNAAQTRAEIGRKKYNNGLLTFEDWDVIENDLINRQKAYLQSRRDRVIAEAAWEKAQGKGVIP